MKDKIMTFSFLTLLISFMVYSIVLEDKTVSYSERRTLKQFPDFNLDNVLSGDFMEDFDKYSVDHFPLRDEFRNIKATFMFDVFKSLDNNGIYIYQDGIYKMESNYNEKDVIGFYEKLNYIQENYFPNNDLYYSIIPDKNYYVNSDMLNYDYNNMMDTIISNMNDEFNYIDIIDFLSLDDFYKTDTHWDQAYLFDLAKYITSNMGVEIKLENMIEKTYEPFYGVYYGQSALTFNPDVIKYYTNDMLDSLQAYHFETDSYIDIYDQSKLGAMDSYDVFLSGASYLITIDNPNATTDKELIIFRDSFGSSITPLMLEGYSKVTLVDIRYMKMDMLPDLIDINNQDVLFMYSTLVINSSNILKVY